MQTRLKRNNKDSLDDSHAIEKFRKQLRSFHVARILNDRNHSTLKESLAYQWIRARCTRVIRVPRVSLPSENLPARWYIWVHTIVVETYARAMYM